MYIACIWCNLGKLILVIIGMECWYYPYGTENQDKTRHGI